MTDKLQAAVTYLADYCSAAEACESSPRRSGHIRTVLSELTRLQTHDERRAREEKREEEEDARQRLQAYNEEQQRVDEEEEWEKEE